MTSSRPSLYLAGPDVFEPDAAARFAAMKRICAKHGAVGLSPLDGPAPERPDRDAALAIFDRNVELIRQSNAVVANVTPFRGPSADVGTALEIGIALALRRPAFGYSRAPHLYPAKVQAGRSTSTKQADAQAFAADGFAIEDFGLFDNLMIVGAIERSGGALFFGEEAAHAVAPGAGLDLFETSVAAAVRHLRSDRQAQQ
jgi:nucleoside 2-deoxyribosyltransferase